MEQDFISIFNVFLSKNIGSRKIYEYNFSKFFSVLSWHASAQIHLSRDVLGLVKAKFKIWLGLASTRPCHIWLGLAVCQAPDTLGLAGDVKLAGWA
jgi:hypothetical protein